MFPTIFFAVDPVNWLQIPSYRYMYLEAKTELCHVTILQSNDNNWYIGDALFRTYYSVFDVDHSQMLFTPVSYFPDLSPIYKKRKGSSDDDDVEDWKIAVIVLSVVLGVAAIGAVVYFIIKRRKASGESEVGKPLQEVSLHA